jgi:hypothetical protein
MNSMKRMVSLFAYRLLLRLHPASFQDEFGAEMLWIFDQEQQQGAVAHLLLDGAISLLRQRSRIQNAGGQLSITSGTIITAPGIGPVRLLQGGITFSLIFFVLMQLLSRPNLLTVSVRWSDRAPCYTVTLQAPSHAEVVLDSMP